MQSRRFLCTTGPFLFRTTSRNVAILRPRAVRTTPKMRFLRGAGCHTVFSSWTSGLTLPRLVTPTADMGKSYCTLTGSDVKNRVETITELFLDARELLEDARSSAGTVYFNDDMQDAKTAVKDALSQYEDLLSVLSTEQKRNVVASIGLKMEELKAQLIAITEEHDT